MTADFLSYATTFRETRFLLFSQFYKMETRDGAVVKALASHQCGPGLIPGLGVICGLSLLLVLVLAPRVFSPGTPVFPPFSETNTFKFQFDLEFESHRFVSHKRLLSVTLAKQSRFIYFIFIFFIFCLFFIYFILDLL